jgi:hypothetical protein
MNAQQWPIRNAEAPTGVQIRFLCGHDLFQVPRTIDPKFNSVNLDFQLRGEICPDCKHKSQASIA